MTYEISGKNKIPEISSEQGFAHITFNAKIGHLHNGVVFIAVPVWASVSVSLFGVRWFAVAVCSVCLTLCAFAWCFGEFVAEGRGSVSGPYLSA